MKYSSIEDESESEIILTSELLDNIFNSEPEDDSSEILLTSEILDELLGSGDDFLNPDVLDVCSNSGLDGSVHEENDAENLCSICLMGIKEEDLAILTPCEHKYCMDCIRQQAY